MSFSILIFCLSLCYFIAGFGNFVKVTGFGVLMAGGNRRIVFRGLNREIYYGCPNVSEKYAHSIFILTMQYYDRRFCVQWGMDKQCCSHPVISNSPKKVKLVPKVANSGYWRLYPLLHRVPVIPTFKSYIMCFTFVSQTVCLATLFGENN